MVLLKFCDECYFCFSKHLWCLASSYSVPLWAMVCQFTFQSLFAGLFVVLFGDICSAVSVCTMQQQTYNLGDSLSISLDLKVFYILVRIRSTHAYLGVSPGVYKQFNGVVFTSFHVCNLLWCFLDPGSCIFSYLMLPCTSMVALDSRPNWWWTKGKDISKLATDSEAPQVLFFFLISSVLFTFQSPQTAAPIYST